MARVGLDGDESGAAASAALLGGHVELVDDESLSTKLVRPEPDEDRVAHGHPRVLEHEDAPALGMRLEDLEGALDERLARRAVLEVARPRDEALDVGARGAAEVHRSAV